MIKSSDKMQQTCSSMLHALATDGYLSPRPSFECLRDSVNAQVLLDKPRLA